MQSSFNVIKQNSVVPQGSKPISTQFSPIDELKEETIKSNIESYENLAKTMLENARKQSEAILSKAYEEAQRLEREAYNNGYQAGQEQGYKEAYEETIEQASQQAEAILNNANNILNSAKAQYERYLTDKKEEIISLSINMAETILRRELLQKDGLNDMIYEVLSNSRNVETYIIKVNSIYIEELKMRVNDWKERLGLKGEIFIVPDESVDQGNAEIEKNNGRIAVGISAGMDSIRQALM